jgi:hypothetical protein
MTGKVMLVALIFINSLGLPFIFFYKSLNLEFQLDKINLSWLLWLIVIYYLFQGKSWARKLYFGAGIFVGIISFFYAVGILINIKTKLVSYPINFDKAIIIIAIAVVYIIMGIFGLTSWRIDEYLQKRKAKAYNTPIK